MLKARALFIAGDKTFNDFNALIILIFSAGVGRSGAFILIDSMRRHLLRCDRINVNYLQIQTINCFYN